MKKNEKEKVEKVKTRKENKKIYNIAKKTLFITILILIFIIAPKLTNLTKEIVKVIYELKDEYITRFWTIILVLISMAFTLFINKKEK